MLLICVIIQSWGDGGDVAQPYNFSLMGTAWEESVYAFDATVLVKLGKTASVNPRKVFNWKLHDDSQTTGAM